MFPDLNGTFPTIMILIVEQESRELGLRGIFYLSETEFPFVKSYPMRPRLGFEPSLTIVKFSKPQQHHNFLTYCLKNTLLGAFELSRTDCGCTLK